MKRTLEKIFQGAHSLFRLTLPFRVRLFNVLALAGGIISLVNGIFSYTNNQDGRILGMNLAIAVLSFVLLFYASKSGRYQFCYVVTIVMIFLLMFPYLFFNSGGYKGGMISFYIFGILFTVFMLEGKSMLFTAVLEMIVYIGTILIAYRYPALVVWFSSEKEVVTDLLIGFCASSISVAAVMYLHFRMYNAQQKILEEARKEAQSANKAKSAFLANMSHEIRTPINVMLGMNEMILRESDSEEICQYAKSIERSGLYLTSLINNVLDFSRIESGKMESEEERYELRQLLEEVMLIGEKQAEEKGLKIRLIVDENLPENLIGDMIHMKQVLLNLLNNAVKYTKEGQIVLKANEKECETGPKLVFEVTDTGIGIKESDVKVLFDAFTRVNYKKNQSIEGTGLGLSIARQLVEQMGGKISVKSVYGEGSSFFVELPLKAVTEDVTNSGVRFSEMKRSEERTHFIAPEAKILAVDDNRENLMVVKFLLKRTSIFVDTAFSGSECLRKVRKQKYDLILLDYMMPGLDGIETMRELKKEKEFKVPVVALTADVTKGTEQRFLKEGFCAYLSKPIIWKKLEDLLRQYLPENLLVIAREEDSQPEMGNELENQIAGILNSQDIQLEEGLKLLDGDFMQYRKLVEFFAVYQKENMNQLEELISQGEMLDAESFTRMMHTLKSNAKAIGAMQLYELAKELEVRGKKKDTGYILSGYSLLVYEWKRVLYGAQTFLEATKETEQEEKIIAQNARKEAQETLKNQIMRYQAKEAEKEIQSFLNSKISSEERKLLEAMKEAVDGLEFDEAERLLGQWEEIE